MGSKIRTGIEKKRKENLSGSPFPKSDFPSIDDCKPSRRRVSFSLLINVSLKFSNTVEFPTI